MHKKLKAVDFFCSGGGMTSGFKKAGINVLGGIDIDIRCKKTYEANHPNSKFILADVKKLSFAALTKELRIKRKDDHLVFIGCSPCQYWTKIKTNKSKSEESKNLLNDFQKFVKYFKPGFVVIENVPGILSKIDESPLKHFLNFLDKSGYSYAYKIVNASKLGVPQTRRRFLLIASRINKNIQLPKEIDENVIPTVRAFIGNKKIFKPIIAGHRDKTSFHHTACALSEDNIKRLKLTPHNGGTRMSWKNTSLQIPAYTGKDDSFGNVYSRMFWDQPGPTITTKFYSISNGRFAHPEENRAISLREAATLQTFDLDYKFESDSILTIARLIGNAVPPILSKRIAECIHSMLT